MNDVNTVLKVEHTFALEIPQSVTLQRNVTLIVKKIWMLQAYLTSYSYTGTVVSLS